MTSRSVDNPIVIYIDADACPVKQEMYRVTERHASRAVKAGAEVIAPNGRAFTADSIGMTSARRNLTDSLRRVVEI